MSSMAKVNYLTSAYPYGGVLASGLVYMYYSSLKGIIYSFRHRKKCLSPVRIGNRSLISHMCLL